MTCATCNVKLHLDTCSTVTDSHYCYLSAKSKAEWNCGPCIRNKGSKKLSIPVRSQTLTSNQAISTTPKSDNLDSPRHLNVTFRKKTTSSLPRPRLQSPSLNENASAPVDTDDIKQMQQILLSEIKGFRKDMLEHLKLHDSKLAEVQASMMTMNSKWESLKAEVDDRFNTLERESDEYGVIIKTVESNNRQVSELLLNDIRLDHDVASVNQKLDTIESKITYLVPFPRKTTSHQELPIQDKRKDANITAASPSFKTVNDDLSTKSTSLKQAPQSTAWSRPCKESSLVSSKYSKPITQDQDTSDLAKDDESDWQIYQPRKSKRNINQTVIKGCGQQQVLQTVERSQKLHICFLKPNTTSTAIKDHMESISGTPGLFEVEKLKLKHDRYASFVLSIPESYYQLYTKPESWPVGTEVRKWFRQGAGRVNRPYTSGQHSV